MRIAVPMAKNTSRAHPRISPTTPGTAGAAAGAAATAGFSSVLVSVSLGETGWKSGSVVILVYWQDPLPNWKGYFKAEPQQAQEAKGDSLPEPCHRRSCE